MGEALFSDSWGDLLSTTRGWNFDTDWDPDWDPEDEEGPGGWELRDRAFIVAVDGSGNYGLLAPDQLGIARRLVFCDQETGRLGVVVEDVDAILSDLA